MKKKPVQTPEYEYTLRATQPAAEMSYVLLIDGDIEWFSVKDLALRAAQAALRAAQAALDDAKAGAYTRLARTQLPFTCWSRYSRMVKSRDDFSSCYTSDLLFW